MNKQQKQQLDKKFTKKFLTQLYWDEELSLNEIIKKHHNTIYGITYAYIWKRFKELNIPLRTNKEGTKIGMVKIKKKNLVKKNKF